MNGSQGIGTGYSTKIPMHNPLDICKYVRNKIEGLETKPIIPWYRGFRGKIEPTSKGSFITRGTYTISEKSILITELPIGTWTEKYIEELDKMSVERGKENAKQFVRDVIDNSSEDKVHIEVFINPVNLHKWANKIGKDGVPEIENRLKLTSSLSSSNLVAFNRDNKITKYNSICDMIDEWFEVRKVIYVKRRDYLLKKLKNDLDIIKYRVQFIEEIVEDKRVINKKKKDVSVVHSMIPSKIRPLHWLSALDRALS